MTTKRCFQRMRPRRARVKAVVVGCALAALWPVDLVLATAWDVLPAGTGYCADSYPDHPNYFRGASNGRWVIDVNFPGDEGTPLRAPEAGTVSVETTGFGGGWGNSIVWTNQAGTESLHMAHLATTGRTGAVAAGDQIGTIGNTGNSDFAHLHISRRSVGVPAQVVLSGQTLNPAFPPGVYGAWPCRSATYTSAGQGGTPPPPADADGDGIVDTDDACPNESGYARFRGCPHAPWNLLRDGGFESGAVGWSALPPPAGGTTNTATYKDAALAHDGPGFLEANTPTDGGSVYQDVAVNLAQHESASFSIWVRQRPGALEPAPSVGVCLWSLGAPPVSACKQVALTKEWQPVQVTATMPTAIGQLRAQVYMTGRGNIDFDGAVVSRSLLRDGGFESGGVGWSALPPPAGGTTNTAIYRDGVLAHDGAGFLEANTPTDGGSIYQDIPVSLGQFESASFSIWVRQRPDNPSPVTKANVCLWAITSPSVPACREVTLSKVWQPVQVTATMPTTISLLRAQVYMTGRGNINFDGAVVTKNLLRDGGFEGGSIGWSALPPPAAGITNTATYRDAGLAHDGSGFLEANTPTDGGSIYQDIPVSLAQFESASFSIWVRQRPSAPEPAPSVGVCLWSLGAPPVSACKGVVLTKEWQPVQVTATMPTAITQLRAQVYMTGRGNIDFDSAVVGAPPGLPVPVVAPAPVVAPVVTPAVPATQTAVTPPTRTPVALTVAATPKVVTPTTQSNAVPLVVPTSGVLQTGRCRVPRLAGVTVKVARARLAAAGCSLGSVRRPAGVTGRVVVASASLRAGRIAARGTRVGLTLRSARRHHTGRRVSHESRPTVADFSESLGGLR